ncbi:MAG TPA: hypothetical protein VNS62_11510, partial [Candidatus Udaeobacter sp.]|nr:hypothetical protein [Candidatus Udaeobacter sp.]
AYESTGFPEPISVDCPRSHAAVTFKDRERERYEDPLFVPAHSQEFSTFDSDEMMENNGAAKTSGSRTRRHDPKS